MSGHVSAGMMVAFSTDRCLPVNVTGSPDHNCRKIVRNSAARS